MDELYAVHDKKLFNTEGEDDFALAVDTPSASVSYHASWDDSDESKATKSLSETFRIINENIHPALSSYLAAKEATSSLNRFAETIKPIASVCAMEGAVTVAKKMQECLSFSPSVTEALQVSATIDTIAITESLRKSIPAVIDVYQPALVKDVAPVQTAFEAYNETMKVTFNISGIISAITKTFVSIGRVTEVFDRVHYVASRFSELIHCHMVESFDCFHGLIHLFFRNIRTDRSRRSHVLALPIHGSIIRAVTLVKFSPSKPKQIREFAVQIRESFLQKHQRIGEDPDDLDDNFSLAFVTP